MIIRHQPTKYQRGIGQFLLVCVLFLVIGAMVFFGQYARTQNNYITEKFESRRWDIPTQVYSRPLRLQVDKLISKDEVTNWLSLLGYSKATPQEPGTYSQKGNTLIIHTRGFEYGSTLTNPPQVLQIEFDANKIVRIKSNVPNTEGHVDIEPISIGKIHPEQGEDRVLITLDNTPKTLIDALIATEDRGFYRHYGISLRGTTRAVINNLKGGGLQGGSTLTQQLIKNFYLSPERSLKRKANEAVMAVLLEMNYSKKAILEAYINEIHLGQNGDQSINGFGLASQFYFNKPLSEIRLDQQALLVGIIKGSSHYNPRKHPERALQRRNIVLNNMFDMGYIDQATYQEAIAYPLDVSDLKKVAIARPKFPDFLDYVRRELVQLYKKEDLQTAGLKIITTLDPIAQTAAQNAFDKQLGRLQNNKKGLQGALVSADRATGEVLALVGSASNFTGFNRAIDAKRQVGSLLKPVIYALALQSKQYTLASQVLDEPISYEGWTPKNYSHVSHGATTLTTALTHSYNQAAVNTGMQIGLERFVGYLNKFGMQVPAYPASLLGATEQSPLQILSLYQVFANGGKYAPLHAITSVINESNQIIQQHTSNEEKIYLEADAAYLINHALKQVVKEGTAKSASVLGEVAGKTGTTNEAKDAWFAGYDGHYVSVVWVGRDDNKPIGLTGSSGALPIWVDYMKRLPMTPIQIAEPNSITWGYVEALTAHASTQDCPTAVYIPYANDTLTNGLSDCQLAQEQLIQDHLTQQQMAAPTDEQIVSLDELPTDTDTPQQDTLDTPQYDESHLIDANEQAQ